MSTADLFDSFANRYEQVLSDALQPTGEGRQFFIHGRIAVLQSCLRELNFIPENILDFGCGDGACTPTLLNALGGNAAKGLDISPSSIELASRRSSSQLTFSLVSAFQPAADMDLAYSNGVFHHIVPAERVETLRFISRCLKPSGLFAMWENNPWNLGARWVMSRCAFDRGAQLIGAIEAKRLFRLAGFQIIRTDYAFVFPNVLRLFRNLENLLRNVPLGAQYQILARKAV
jgi:SAM-dependent methyltransferase